MKDEDYPQEISPDESRLGFELLLIDGIGALMGSQIYPIPVPVAAKVLSSSDVVIKIYDLDGNVRYSHRRWGHYTTNTRNEWIPLSNPKVDLNEFIFDFNAGTHPELFVKDIEPGQFTYRKAAKDK